MINVVAIINMRSKLTQSTIISYVTPIAKSYIRNDTIIQMNIEFPVINETKILNLEEYCDTGTAL